MKAKSGVAAEAPFSDGRYRAVPDEKKSLVAANTGLSHFMSLTGCEMFKNARNCTCHEMWSCLAMPLLSNGFTGL